MSNVIIRPAQANDLSTLADLWLEKMVLLTQADPRFSLASDAAAQWSAHAAQWLTHERYRLLVAQEERIIGFAIGWLQDMPPGVLPARIGVITELALDMHHYQQNTARPLLTALQTWFHQQGVDQLTALVPHRHPLQQAFWRSLGAADWIDILWLK